MKTKIFISAIIISLSLLAVQSCKKDTMLTENETYFPRVKAIIQTKCLSCHSSVGAWNGRPTEFDTDSQIVAAHASIKAAVADPPTLFNKRMPQDGTLSESEIDAIMKWNAKGGKVTD